MTTREFKMTYVAWVIFLLDSTALENLHGVVLFIWVLKCESDLNREKWGKTL